MKIVEFKTPSKPRLVRQIAKPSDYGLVLAAKALVRDWGKFGAINRLIEVAELLEQDRSLDEWILPRRRVEAPISQSD